MTIGLKYCGGCNSIYDRKQVVEKLRNSFPEVEFIYPDERSEFDFLVVISGCHVNCAGHKHLSPKQNKYFITEESHIAKVIEKIRKEISD